MCRQLFLSPRSARSGERWRSVNADDDPQASGDGDPEPDRRGDRDLPVDPRAARRSGGLFRGPRGDATGHPGGAGQARPRQAADRAIRPLRGRSRPRQSRHLAHHRAAGRDRIAHPAAGFRGADAARAPGFDRRRGAAWNSGGDQPNSLVDHACRVIATLGVSLPVFFTGLILVYVSLLSPRLGACAARPARRVLHPAVANHRLLSDRQLDRGRCRNFHGEPQAADPAGTHARHFLACADRAHDARLDARGAVVGLCAHRACQRPLRPTP